MMIKFLDLYHQYQSIKSEIDQAIADTISASAFVNGESNRHFEREFALFQDAEHCVGVGNGTDALEIAIEALGLERGSEILVPANSFIASSEAVTRSGHRVVFVDVDPGTYLVSLRDAKRRLTERTRAIICVHLYGCPCDMSAVMAFASRHNLRVVEDGAQAHGALWRGRKVGAIGDVGAFSFYPGKNLGAYGDGGAIVTNDSGIAERCRRIANHGRAGKFDHDIEGRNSRLDGLQAAILRTKLRHLPAWTLRRNEIADRYVAGLSHIEGLVLPRVPLNAVHSFHLFVIRTPHQAALAQHLQLREIQTGRHYPMALPKLAAYRYLGQAEDEMAANRMDSELLSLPIGEHLTDDAVDAVIAAVDEFFRESLGE